MARRRRGKRRPAARGWNWDNDAVSITHTTEFADSNSILSYDQLLEAVDAAVDIDRAPWFVKRVIIRGQVRLTGRTSTLTRPRRRVQVGLGIATQDVWDAYDASASVSAADMWASFGPWNDRVRRVLQQEVVAGYDVWEPGQAATGALSTTSNAVTNRKAQLFEQGPPWFTWDLRLSEGLRDDESLRLAMSVDGLDLEWEDGDAVECEYWSKILLQKRRGA